MPAHEPRLVGPPRRSAPAPRRRPLRSLRASDDARRARSKLRPVGPRRFRERRPILDDDRLAVTQNDAARIAAVPRLAVDPNRETVPPRRLQARGGRPAQVRPPNVEELAQVERPLDRRFDVNDPARVVRVNPIEARRALRHADARRNRNARPAIVQLQVEVNVLDRTLLAIAANPIDRKRAEETLRQQRRGEKYHRRRSSLRRIAVSWSE